MQCYIKNIINESNYVIVSFLCVTGNFDGYLKQQKFNWFGTKMAGCKLFNKKIY